MNRVAALIPCLFFPVATAALEIAMPQGSVLAEDEVKESGSYALPDGPFYDGALSSRQLTGHVSHQAWHLQGEDLDPEQLIAPLRSQLEASGFAILLDCDASSCGGFDFRFATEVMPAPGMFVDLANYRFVSALKDTSEGTEAVSVLVSTSDIRGYTQLIAVLPGPEAGALPLDKPVVTAPIAPTVVDPAIPSDLIKSLDLGGHVVLSDLEFETGSANLAGGDFDSLQAIAAYLIATPDARIALVGHTDNVGSLEANVALSERRALAVKAQLVDDLGVPAARIDAQGVGYLAPIASNKTDSGRNANRRVEAVLLSQ